MKGPMMQLIKKICFLAFGLLYIQAIIGADLNISGSTTLPPFTGGETVSFTVSVTNTTTDTLCIKNGQITAQLSGFTATPVPPISKNGIFNDSGVTVNQSDSGVAINFVNANAMIDAGETDTLTFTGIINPCTITGTYQYNIFIVSQPFEPPHSLTLCSGIYVSGNSFSTSFEIVGSGFTLSIDSSASTVCQNGSVTVTANSNPPMTGLIYQWTPGGSTPTSQMTTIPGSELSNTPNNISVTATSSSTGCIASDSTTVTVEAVPTVTITPPSPIIVNQGASLTLTANVQGGTGPFTYQWLLNGAPIIGANASNYMPSTTVPGTYEYAVTVTDTGTGCVVTSANTEVIVTDPPTSLNLEIVVPCGKPLTIYPLPVICNNNCHIVVAGPARHGKVTFTSNSITYIPCTKKAKCDSFTYSVQNNSTGVRTQGTITVILSNEGQPKCIKTQCNTPVILNAFDKCCCRVQRVTGVAQPAHGVVTFNQFTVTYVPNSNFSGVDTFSYTAINTHNQEIVVPVTIKVQSCS